MAKSPPRITRRPVIRHFVICERIEDEPGDGRTTLRMLTNRFRLQPGTHFPTTRTKPLHFYVELSDVHGVHTFVTTRSIAGVGGSTIASAPVTVDLGNDPVADYELNLETTELRFPQAGAYEFDLICGGEVVATAVLFVEAAP